MVVNTSDIRKINLDTLKNALKSVESGTKNSLAAETGLSVATCKNLLEEMLLSGEVREIEMSPSSGGRPSRCFVYNANHSFALLLSLRKEGVKESVYCSVVNLQGEQLFEFFEDNERITLQVLDVIVSRIKERYPRISVISIGVPGIVRLGTIRQCDIEGLSNTSLKEHLEETQGIRTCVENDVNAAALGYYQRMDKENPESLVYIYYPLEGKSGAGIIINGKVVKGRRDFAGELSYMPLWIAREEQGTAQKNRELFCELVCDTLLTVNSVLDPDRIVLSGEIFDDTMIAAVKTQCRERAPEGYVPSLRCERDIHFSYLDGLKFSALKQLSCGIEIVSNREV